MELIRTPTRQQFMQALETWSWIGLGRRVPLFTSLFGDVFLESYDGYWWLDSVAGRLVRPWATIEELEGDLDSAAGQQQYLRAGLALDAELRNLVPAEDELYGFRVAPAVGGALDVRNLEVMELTLRIHLTGQLHHRAREISVGPGV